MGQVLRPSLFHNVPPFINFVPSFDPDPTPRRGPQLWDQDSWDQEHFWRIPLALAKWIREWSDEEKALNEVPERRGLEHLNIKEGVILRKVSPIIVTLKIDES